LGNARETLQHAARQLGQHAGIHSLSLSRFYSSAPIDSHGPDYVNAVAQLSTTLAPLELLDVLQQIELEHGRQRPYRNAPRTLDLDLLLYGTQRVNHERLVVPHPRMHQRAFVLVPLQELAPRLCLPQGPVSVLVQACSDQQLRPLISQPPANAAHGR
jgi:2-amino-4-hydroxy-6-hydroxymethyldihydropteridine diphosphokinase